MASLPEIHRITGIVDETPLVKTFFVDGSLEMSPGQFYMVWLPGVDEKPFTLSYVGKSPAVSIRRHGLTTTAFHSLKAGDRIGFRGPFGRGFTLPKTNNTKIAVVAGGIGMIGLASLMDELHRRNINVTVICGAKTGNELIFAKRFKADCCSDDGSEGVKCFAPAMFENLLKENKYDMVYTCGPEAMMRSMLEICTRHSLRMEAGLERYMKCGLGLCASCVCGDKLVCKDGPVFSGDELIGMADFGKRTMLMSGRIVSLG